MVALLCFLLALFTSPFKSKSRLEAENAALRHQLTVLRRKVRGRVQLTNGDRLFLVQLYRWFPSVLTAAPRTTAINPASVPLAGPAPAPSDLDRHRPIIYIPAFSRRRMEWCR